MATSNRWIVAPTDSRAGELAKSLKVSPLLAQVLINRGVVDAAEAQAFLRPSLSRLHDPMLLAGLPAAAERIARAVRDGEKIVIYGDYDVDGITASAILWHAVRVLGGIVDYYVPHRIEEGYGLNADAVREICDAGARLIVTVDCGITAIAPAAAAAERGVDLIITDHHEWHDGQPLPQCCAIVHPRLPGPSGQPYPNPSLCGAGVAFKLAWGIGLAMSNAAKVDVMFRAFLIDATALAALGTIADVVPLVGENRVLAAFGLSGLRQSRLVGLHALIESAGLTGQQLDAYHVGFLLAPRLNASGRMGHAKLAVELLTTADTHRAAEIADFLENQNRERRALEKEIFRQALEQASQLGYDRDDCRGIVLAGEGWHAGVIGIVASRVVERFHRPVVMISLSDTHGQGSARSISGFHLAHALHACHDHLETYGGHEMAAGLKLQPDRVPDFRQAFHDYARTTLRPEQLVPQIRLETVAPLRQLNQALVSDLARLGPFGMGNRRPVLCCPDVTLAAAPRRVGKTGDHLQLLVRQGADTMQCIAFNAADRFADLPAGSRINLAAEPSLNEYQGHRSVQLEIRDLQPADDTSPVAAAYS